MNVSIFEPNSMSFKHTEHSLVHASSENQAKNSIVSPFLPQTGTNSAKLKKAFFVTYKQSEFITEDCSQET